MLNDYKQKGVLDLWFWPNLSGQSTVLNMPYPSQKLVVVWNKQNFLRV